MTARPPPVETTVPLTSTRALRLAVTRAADPAFGLSLTVSEVAEDLQQLDGVMSGLASDDSYLRIGKNGELAGLMGLDVQLRAATIEMQTMGRLSDQLAVDRPYTGTDMMLVEPLCVEVLSALPITTQASDLEGWAENVTLGAPFANLRAAGLELNDCAYQIMKITVDLSDQGRQGVLTIVLPTRQAQVVVPVEMPETDDLWDQRMHAAVSAAPATLNAVLHQMQLPLGMVNNLGAGDILPLYGATVGSVRLFAPDNVGVITARLGQSGGMRAVRIQPPPDPYMRDIPAPVSAAEPLAEDETPARAIPAAAD